MLLGIGKLEWKLVSFRAFSSIIFFCSIAVTRLKWNMAAELLFLQWNEFQGNQMSFYRSLRETPDFSDVTLVCEDGQRIQAHRLVLASSSFFFKDFLQREANPHPLVFMRGLTHNNLAALVDYIYHGEVEVKTADLEEFLKAVGELHVKGITRIDKGGEIKDQDKEVIKEELDEVEDNSMDASIEEDTKEGSELECDERGRTYGPNESLRNPKYEDKKSREHGRDENLINVDVALREEADVVKHEPTTKERHDCNECGRTYGSKNSLRTHKYVHKNSGEESVLKTPLDASPESGKDQKHNLDLSVAENPLWEEKIDALAEYVGDGWKCRRCGKQDRNRSWIRRHVESHIEGFTFPCHLCEKTFSKRYKLKTHMGAVHGGGNLSRMQKEKVYL